MTSSGNCGASGQVQKARLQFAAGRDLDVKERTGRDYGRISGGNYKGRTLFSLATACGRGAEAWNSGGPYREICMQTESKAIETGLH